jgi:hypothetical protein
MREVDKTYVNDLANDDHKSSPAALWMLLLLRLTAVSSDDRLEVRNSAIQTLLRIFDAYGDRLSAEAWSICIKSVVFKLLTSLREELKTNEEDEVEANDRKEWYETAVVILNGISTLLANYLDVLTAHPSFNELWRELLEQLAALIDFEVLSINTATFKALAHVLSQTSDGGKPKFSSQTIDFAWNLWSRGIPNAKSRSGEDEDNQPCLIAYVEALKEVYRLIQDDLTKQQVERILTLLYQTAQEASMGSFAVDVENMTQLQAKIMDAVRMIRTDVDGVPSVMLMNASHIATMAFEREYVAAARPKRTFVALSRAGIAYLEGVVLKHASVKDVYTSGALSRVLEALCKPIALKYGFPITTKSAQPWEFATTSALAVLEATLPEVAKLNVDKETVQQMWKSIVNIAASILKADCANADAGTDFRSDENFDIESFGKLRKLIIPRLGADDVLDKTRKSFAESLFKTSIIHAPAECDGAIIDSGSEVGLSALYEARTGRTVFVPPTQRSNMAYVAFDELFALVANNESAGGPRSAKEENSKPKSAPAKRIASTVAPFLIVRCALTLRAYVADQPLRGKMPQPLSQRKELLWTLGKLVDLQSDAEAIPALQGAQSDSRKHLLRLYPLMVKALVAGGDDKVLSLLQEALDVIGGELGIA